MLTEHSELKQHGESDERALREHSKSIQGAFSEHSESPESMQRVFREHSARCAAIRCSETQKKAFREHSERPKSIQREFRGHAGIMQRDAPPGDIHKERRFSCGVLR